MIPKNFDPETDWMGVDFDGTLHRRPPKTLFVLGEPILEMVERIKGWLAEGMEVKIVTARVSDIQREPMSPEQLEAFQAHQRRLISDWCEYHIGEKLEVVCAKDAFMYQLWDDRAVCVEHNTGKVLGMNPPW